MSTVFELPVFCLITKGEATAENFPQNKQDILNIIRTAVKHRIGIVQVREKRLPAGLLLDLVTDAVDLAKDTSTRILVNDRADIALAAGAAGVHLPSDSFDPAVIREKFPEDFIVGASTHSLQEAHDAAAQGVDFVLFGPVYETPGKGAPVGLEQLKEVCRRLVNVPVLALGGIDVTNYDEAIDAGAAGIAAIRFLNEEKNVRTIAARF